MIWCAKVVTLLHILKGLAMNDPARGFWCRHEAGPVGRGLCVQAFDYEGHMGFPQGGMGIWMVGWGRPPYPPHPPSWCMGGPLPLLPFPIFSRRANLNVKNFSFVGIFGWRIFASVRRWWGQPSSHHHRLDIGHFQGLQHRRLLAPQGVNVPPPCAVGVNVAGGQ